MCSNTRIPLKAVGISSRNAAVGKKCGYHHIRLLLSHHDYAGGAILEPELPTRPKQRDVLNNSSMT